MTKKQKPRRRGPLARVTLGLRVDVLGVLSRVAGACRLLLAPRPRVVAWADVPVGALVMSAVVDGSLTRIRSLCLRSSPLQGALVGVVNPDSGPHCDDFYEHEPWDRLGRRRGSALVTVLARRVRSAATADDLEGLASAALAREVTK